MVPELVIVDGDKRLTIEQIVFVLREQRLELKVQHAELASDRWARVDKGG